MVEQFWSAFIGAFAGAVAALITQIIHWWREGSRREAELRSKQTVVAAKVAHLLDHFAFECAEEVAEKGLNEQFQGMAGRMPKGLPDFNLSHHSEDLKILSAKNQSELHAIELRLFVANSEIRTTSQLQGNEDAFDEIERQCVMAGKEALDLAKKLRGEVGLVSPSYGQFRWDFKKMIEDEHAKVTEFLEKVRA